MKRSIRVILASAGAAAVVTGGALGVAYATTPAKTSPSPERPAATQLSARPSASTVKPEASESSATVEAEAEKTTEATKAPTTRPSKSESVKPYDDSTSSVEADDDDSDHSTYHDDDEGDHKGAGPSAPRSSSATSSPDRPHPTRR